MNWLYGPNESIGFNDNLNVRDGKGAMTNDSFCRLIESPANVQPRPFDDRRW